MAQKLNGAVLMFFCESGYSLIGSAEIYCDGGQWNGTIPYCRSITKNSFLFIINILFITRYYEAYIVYVTCFCSIYSIYLFFRYCTYYFFSPFLPFLLLIFNWNFILIYYLIISIFFPPRDDVSQVLLTFI